MANSAGKRAGNTEHGNTANGNAHARYRSRLFSIKFDRNNARKPRIKYKSFPVTLRRRGISCLKAGLDQDLGVSMNGVPPNHPLKYQIFNEINHPAIGVPPLNPMISWSHLALRTVGPGFCSCRFREDDMEPWIRSSRHPARLALKRLRRLLVRDAAGTGNSHASLQLVVSEIIASCGYRVSWQCTSVPAKFDQWYSSCGKTFPLCV